MKCYALCLAVFFGGALVSVHGQTPTPANPITIEQTSEFGVGSARTLKEYIREVPLIAKVRISARELSPIEPSMTDRLQMARHAFEGMPQVFSRYRAQILAPVKDLEKLYPEGSEITFLQQAGEMKWKQYLIRANSAFPLLEPDGIYVLFLKWSDLLNEFIVEPQGVYSLNQGRVSSPSPLAFARQLRDHELRDFIKMVQQAVEEHQADRRGYGGSVY